MRGRHLIGIPYGLPEFGVLGTEALDLGPQFVPLSTCSIPVGLQRCDFFLVRIHPGVTPSSGPKRDRRHGAHWHAGAWITTRGRPAPGLAPPRVPPGAGFFFLTIIEDSIEIYFIQRLISVKINDRLNIVERFDGENMTPATTGHYSQDIKMPANKQQGLANFVQMIINQLERGETQEALPTAVDLLNDVNSAASPYKVVEDAGAKLSALHAELQAKHNAEIGAACARYFELGRRNAKDEFIEKLGLL